MYFGWRVVGGTFVGLAFVTGFFTYAVSLLTQPVQETFSVTVEQVMYGLTFGTFLGLLVAPVVGALVDRVSARLLVGLGIVFFAAGLYLMSLAQSIGQYIAAFGVTMTLANSLAGTMIASTLVSRWFSSNRGKALGISAVGTSVGGVMMPALLTYWIGEHGWREALQYLALVIVLAVLPVMLWTIRSWPVDVGLEPLEGSDGQDSTQLTFKDIAKNPNFWWLALSLALFLSTYSATLSNLTPFLMSLDYSGQSASTLIMVIAISGLVGKVLFGMAADKFSHKSLFWTAQLLVCITYLLFASGPVYSLAFLAAVAMGLAAGGILPIWGALIADLFGLANYGKAMGLMGPVITLCVMVAHPLPGRLYQMSGDFSLGFYVFTAAVIVAALLLVPMSIAHSAEVEERGLDAA